MRIDSRIKNPDTHSERISNPLERPTAKMTLRDETTQIRQWHQAYSESVMQEAAAQELGLTQIIAQLVVKNNEVETLMGQRSDEAAQKADVQLSADRKAVDEAMRDFTQMLNALDPTPSAPSVEPVVTARRIVSLDPKAQKAGGLCVALKGTPVRPADEVDAAKEYQLVSYGE